MTWSVRADLTSCGEENAGSASSLRGSGVTFSEGSCQHSQVEEVPAYSPRLRELPCAGLGGYCIQQVTRHRGTPEHVGEKDYATGDDELQYSRRIKELVRRCRIKCRSEERPRSPVGITPSLIACCDRMLTSDPTSHHSQSVTILDTLWASIGLDRRRETLRT